MTRKRFSVDTTILKIFLSFTLLSAVVALLLFLITFLGTAAIVSDTRNAYEERPREILRQISAHLIITEESPVNAENTETSAAPSAGAKSIFLSDETLLPADSWCILLDESGNIIWSLHKPDDIPSHYSLNDVARMTRWFLNDYPVYVRCEDYGLLVLGRPKNAVGKYNLEYSMKWVRSLPQRILFVLLFNFALAALFSFLFGSFLYKKIKLLTTGLFKLRKEEAVSLPARGIFKEPFLSINKTSQAIARKNALLATRDKARSNWIAGISHDIRTPLSMVIGYGEQLSEKKELSEENRQYAAIITAQGLKIKKLIEDLNLISSLEYDMQPVDKKDLQICPLIRSVVSDILNQGLSDRYEILLELNCEQGIVSANERLLSRAFFNLLQNSVTHNETGCRIRIAGTLLRDSIFITISDNGQGCPEKILQNLEVLPNTAHGLGLPMSYRIIRAHGGSFHAKNEDGLRITIILPRADQC